MVCLACCAGPVFRMHAYPWIAHTKSGISSRGRAAQRWLPAARAHPYCVLGEIADGLLVGASSCFWTCTRLPATQTACCVSQVTRFVSVLLGGVRRAYFHTHHACPGWPEMGSLLPVCEKKLLCQAPGESDRVLALSRQRGLLA